MHENAAFVAGGGRFPMRASYDAFGHTRHLAEAEFRFVSPNNDPLYSVAVCDLQCGPMVLHVPNTAGRYDVLQFIDGWTADFAYIGRRATGTHEAQYSITERDYDGEIPG